MVCNRLKMTTSAIEFEIRPYESAGPIAFGMAMDQVRAMLAPHPVIRDRSSDEFRTLGIRVHYSSAGTTEAFEFRAPARPTLDGHNLLGQSYGELEQWLASVDGGLKLEHSGLSCMMLGIRLYAASARRIREVPIEVVTVFGRDYRRRYMESMIPPAPG